CQQVHVAGPTADELAAWLGQRPAAELEALALLAGGAPVAMAELAGEDNWNIVKQLDDDLLSISQDRAGPQAVAASWLKAQPGRVLTWLCGRIAGAVRARAAGGTTPVTDTRAPTLHNAWRNLTLATLIDQHGRAERLLAPLGS